MRSRITKSFVYGEAAKKLLDDEIEALQTAIDDDNFNITRAKQALDTHERNLKDLKGSRSLLDNYGIEKNPTG